MRDPSCCPMCGEVIDSEDAAIICGTCRMGIPSGTLSYVAAGGARAARSARRDVSGPMS